MHMTTIALSIPTTETEADQDSDLLFRDQEHAARVNIAVSETFLISGPLLTLDPDLLDYAVAARGYGLCE
jgi:hypothetical protein